MSIQVENGKRFYGAKNGVYTVSMEGPEGRWTNRIIAKSLRPSIKFLGQSSNPSVRLRMLSGAYKIKITTDSEGRYLNYTGKLAHEREYRYYKNALYSLTTGDYYGGLKSFQKEFYKPGVRNGVGAHYPLFLKRTMDHLTRVNDFMCWQFDEWRQMGLSRNQKPAYGAIMGTVLKCPIYIDNEIGVISISFDVLFNPGNLSSNSDALIFPNLNDHMPELERVAAKALKTFKIHLPNVTQPPPINDEHHKNILPLGVDVEVTDLRNVNGRMMVFEKDAQGRDICVMNCGK